MATIRENVRTAFDIPEPPSNKACGAYGGCDFQDICDGKLTEEIFQQRFDLSIKKDKLNIHQIGLITEESMSIFEVANSGQTGNAPPLAAPAAPAAPTAVAVPVAQPPGAAPVAAAPGPGGVFANMAPTTPGAAPQAPPILTSPVVPAIQAAIVKSIIVI